MRAKTLSIVLGLAVSGLTLFGCTTSGLMPAPPVPPALPALPDLTPSGIAGPEPTDYRAVVSISLERVLRGLADSGPLSISSPRRFPSIKGPAWLVCIRTSPSPIPRHYAVFFQHNRVVDYRVSVVLDHCELQSYTPFDWSDETAGAARDPNSETGHLR